MRTIRRAAVYASAAAILFCYSAAARAQGVMDQVPSDALAVLKINRLEQTNQKVGKWTQALGIAQLSPDAADPLGSIQNKLNIKNGLDRNGEAAVVFLDPGKAGGARARGGDGAGDDGGAGGADKAMLILVPVTDYKAFASQLPNANAKGAITSFRPEDANEDVYCANWGKYAVLSPSQAALQNKPQGGMKTTGMAARELKDKDIVLYANLPAIKTRALPHLQKLREQVKQQMAAGAGAGANGGGDEGNVARPATPRRGGAQRGAPGGGARRPTPPPEDQQDNSADNLQISFQTQAGGARQQQPQRQRPQAQPRPARAQQDADNAAANDNANADPDNSNPASARSNRRGGARRGGAGAAGGMDPAMAQYMGAMIDQYFGIAERFLNDGQAATLGFSFNDQGLNTTALAEFTPNSELGNIVQGLKNTDQNLLAGLPDRKYFAFAGGIISPKPSEQIINDLVAPMLQQLSAAQGQGQGKGDPQAITDAMKQIVQNAKTVSVGYTVPTGALGADSIIQAVTVISGNAKAVADAEKKILSNMGNMFQMPGGAGGAGGAPGAPQMSFDIQEGGKTVGGVKLDQYKFNIEMDANNDPRAAQAQQMMAMVYGPNGMSGVMGAVDDNTFLVVQGGTDKLIADAVASAKGKQDALSRSQQVQAVRGQLPKQRVFESYLALDNIIRSGVQYAQGFGLPVKLQLKPNLPPIGTSLASEGTSVRLDSHVPTTLLQNVISAGMQAYTQMQGGGAGGGNPDGL